MKLSITALSLSLASTAVSIALPGGGGGEYHGGGCLSQGTADTIVAEYAAIQAQVSSNLGSAKQTARQLLASDFQETSDSLNELIGLPVRPTLSVIISKRILTIAAARLCNIRQQGRLHQRRSYH